MLPHRGKIKGMAIPQGITLIVGGGYHGKSTLLTALEDGVYNHIALSPTSWTTSSGCCCCCGGGGSNGPNNKSGTPNCDSGITMTNHNSNRHAAPNGTCRRPPDQATLPVATKANGNAVFHPVASSSSSTLSTTHANEEPLVGAPRVVVSDHVQFLITEKQKPRDCSAAESERVDVCQEGQGQGGQQQRKTNLNSDALSAAAEEAEDLLRGEL